MPDETTPTVGSDDTTPTVGSDDTTSTTAVLEAFTIGPKDPVTDSRQLPAVSAEEEAERVQGAAIGDDHPDNGAPEPADADLEIVPPEAAAEDEEELEDASEAELLALVEGVDSEDIDNDGFDEADMQGLAHIDIDAVLGEQPGGS